MNLVSVSESAYSREKSMVDCAGKLIISFRLELVWLVWLQAPGWACASSFFFTLD
jgi:hypothetical protein